ncbi:MAG: hypothetical protein AB9917_21995 [Negativicutes bacterium]
MPKMDLIFVSSGRHPETEALIRKATSSRFAHAALAIDINGHRWIVEAVRPAVRFSFPGLFDHATELQTISVEISEEQRQAVSTKALCLVGQPYGVDDCLIGGAHDLFGDGAAELLDQFLNDDESFNCSGLQTLLVREAFPGYMEGANASMITPEAARQYAMEYFRET